ncbi:hypothetical protein HDU85_000680 [Gaertneriomyces sp. JEL0708]|nr:hypothetical protein HDU85_000680 [Gaertneriomyces sp. JEL0708]
MTTDAGTSTATISTRQVPRALTIAGSDCGGGAGIQADLKTFTLQNVFGTSVLTALTAQNTLGVQGIFPVSSAFILQQLNSVFDDIGADAVKTGMLHNAEVIETVAKALRARNVVKLVVDPVMVSTSGGRLLDEAALSSLTTHLLPLAELITPNVPEAEVLCGTKITSLEDVKKASQKLHSLGSRNVLIKGGHLPFDEAGQPASLDDIDDDARQGPLHTIDTLYIGSTGEFIELRNQFIHTKNTHGTGCTTAAAITSGLAKGETLVKSVADAINFVHTALSVSVQSHFTIGSGHGPLPLLPPHIPSFVQLLKQSCADDWHKYTYHPFVQQIADGTLDVESFKYYIRQDYLFLRHYARANALAAYREHDLEDIVEGARIVGYIGDEVALHIKYCESWGISLEDLNNTPEASPNIAYTRYVLDKGASGDRLDIRVALAPCLLGYGEIGMRLKNDPNTKKEGNPYWPWIENYSKPEFQTAVQEGEILLEKLFREMVPAGNQRRIKQLVENFKQATILEERFWEMGLQKIR